MTARRITTAQRRRFLAARTLAARGMNEAMTWSFLPKQQAELFGGGSEAFLPPIPLYQKRQTFRRINRGAVSWSRMLA